MGKRMLTLSLTTVMGCAVILSGCTAGGTENMHNTPGAVTLELVPEEMEENLNE